jgi:hypothetical protein
MSSTVRGDRLSTASRIAPFVTSKRLAIWFSLTAAVQGEAFLRHESTIRASLSGSEVIEVRREEP